MNPNTTEYIYEHYQADEFHRKYLKQHHMRTDNRQCDQHRDMKISVGHNKVVVNKQNTVVIAEIKTTIQPVTYSPVSQSYGKQLLRICVTLDTPTANKFERNAAKAIEQYVEQFVNWKDIQKQIARTVSVKTGQIVQSSSSSSVQQHTLAHVGQINLRLVDTDGGATESALMATQMLLWTAKFKPIVAESSSFMLTLGQFWFPIKYCQVLDQILVDPNEKEENASNFEVAIVRNLRKNDQPTIIQRVHNTKGASSQYTVSLLKLYAAQVSKLPFNISQVQSKVEGSNEGQQHVILIEGL